MSKIAVIKTGGKQYKVAEGDKIQIEKLETEAGKKVEFKDVLLIADAKGDDLQIGNPVVKGAKVVGEILKQFKDDKVTVIKYKAKVRYRRKIGHRQNITLVKIESIA